MTDINAELDLFYIQVNGTDLPRSAIADLTEVVVEEDLAQPAVFTLRFRDTEFKLIDGTLFRLGDEVQIAASDVHGRRKVILTAEVTALEPELSQDRIELVVRGYDRAHRLYRGRATRTFVKQSYADIFKQVVQEAGLSATVVASTMVSQKFDYVVQDAQSDMAFLRELAANTGYCITVDKRTVTFAPESQRTATSPLQEFGETLMSFRARVTVTAQANEVEVRGWDPSAKRPIVGNATTPSQHPAINNGATGGDSAKKAFSKAAKVVLCDRPVRDGQEAKTLAQAALDDLAGDYLSVEAICLGEPTLTAGATVELKGIGKRFSGTYHITATRHEYADGRYRTTMYVSGRNPISMLSPLQGADERQLVRGVVVGIVTNVNDPQHIGRVKVKYPWFDEKLESDWVRIAAPGGGPQRGFMALPEVNDEMLVAFEHGDMNRPYIVGGLWNPKDKPPAAAVNGEGKVTLRTIRTRAGHTIEFLEDGAAGKGAIEIKTATGMFVKLSDNDKLIRVKSAKHSITLDDQGIGAVTVTSGGTLELTGSGSKLLFRQGAMELTGPGGAKLAFTPAGAELTAMGNKVVLAALGAEVSGTAKLDLKAGALVNVQGALVKIN
jgi:uncharacterized protein involved in type VI secretion and phage assembly